jgi:hypothetical protein
MIRGQAVDDGGGAMNSKQREMLFEIFTGALISQEVVIQLLHRKGLLDKGEVIRSLDYFIEHFEKKNPEQKITVPMHYLKNNLGKYFPEGGAVKRKMPEQKHPPWFQGVILGGRHRRAAVLEGASDEEEI